MGGLGSGLLHVQQRACNINIHVKMSNEYINNSKRSYCTFCENNTKIQGMDGGLFCPNGHYEIKADGTIEEKQPVSVGSNAVGKRVYSSHNHGYLCTKEGVKLKRTKKIYL